jgi:flagellin-like hook-associated protein FlgL
MSDITLSAGVRANLLSLQNTAHLMQTTQNRLATGKKVNSALDNPLNFFTSQSLNSRSSQLSALLDSMSNGIQTIQAANNGLTSITSTVQSMQSTLNQALQDKSFQTASYTVDLGAGALTGNEKLSLSGGSVGATAVDVSLDASTQTTAAAIPAVVAGDNGKQFTVSDGTNTTADISLATGDTTDDIVQKINTAAQTANVSITASNNGGKITLTNAKGPTITVANGTTTGGATVLGFGTTTYAAQTVDQLVSSINANASLTGKVTASNDSGKLRLQNISTSALTVAGVTGSTADGSSSTTTIAGNDVRKSLVAQFNTLRDQLDKYADDSSFNGINLLHGDNLKLTLNENGTSALNIQAKDANGNVLSINSTNLGINSASNSEFDSDATINTKLDALTKALSTLSSQSSSFGSNLSIVQNRQDFTKNMINTLQTGADNLVLADTNEEGANLLALQTRQSLSTTALSLSSQADQAVLQLFG